MVELGPFSNLGILENENLVSKISKEPLELGSWNKFWKQFETSM